MFANPIWSALLLVAPIAVYFLIIRPRLQKPLLKLYAHIDGYWAWIKAVSYAFRTFWIATIGVVATALPDLLVIISPLDFSSVLPQPWPAYTGPMTAAAIALMKAFETKPGEDK